MKIFNCNNCKKSFDFTDSVKDRNYIAGEGFICDSCMYNRDQARLSNYDWQTDC